MPSDKQSPAPEYCRCNKRAPVAYDEGRTDHNFVRLVIEEVGEWMTVTIAGRGSFRVSRHCIAMHGVKAAEIDSYGFEEIADVPG